MTPLSAIEFNARHPGRKKTALPLLRFRVRVQSFHDHSCPVKEVLLRIPLRSQEITFTVTPNKDYFGRAVIVRAEPPKNYTALLYGPYSTNEFKFSKVFFNETGYWDNPGYRGSMQPFTEYTLTINISDTENVTARFMTDVGGELDFRASAIKTFGNGGFPLIVYLFVDPRTAVQSRWRLRDF